MKRIIVVLFILLSINLYADIISADFDLELGWLPQGTLRMYESRDKYDLSNTFYTALKTRVFLFDHIFIGGGMDSSFHKSEYSLTFSPEGIDYMFTTGLKFGIAEFFFKHNCIHPAPTYIYYRKITPVWETAHDRIGIKISGKIN